MILEDDMIAKVGECGQGIESGRKMGFGKADRE